MYKTFNLFFVLHWIPVAANLSGWVRPDCPSPLITQLIFFDCHHTLQSVFSFTEQQLKVGQYEWQDKREVKYSYWSENQPRHLEDVPNCVSINSSTGYWNSVNCAEKKMFICKYSTGSFMIVDFGLMFVKWMFMSGITSLGQALCVFWVRETHKHTERLSQAMEEQCVRVEWVGCFVSCLAGVLTGIMDCTLTALLVSNIVLTCSSM